MEPSGSFRVWVGTDPGQEITGYINDVRFTKNERFSSASECNLTEESDIQIPWEYETFLDIQNSIPMVVQDRQRRRGVGLLKFICEECCNSRHDQCKGGSWCDCQHMVSKRTRDQVEK